MMAPRTVGERGGVRGFKSLDRFEPPHPNPLPIRTRVYPSSAHIYAVEVGNIRLPLEREQTTAAALLPLTSSATPYTRSNPSRSDRRSTDRRACRARGTMNA